MATKVKVMLTVVSSRNLLISRANMSLISGAWCYVVWTSQPGTVGAVSSLLIEALKEEGGGRREKGEGRSEKGGGRRGKGEGRRGNGEGRREKEGKSRRQKAEEMEERRQMR
jgi:hypothetical protein